MKANRLWIIPAALMTGCIPLSPAPDQLDARAHREETSVGPPPVEGEVSARVTHRHRTLPEALAGIELSFDSAGAVELPYLAGRLAEALGAEVTIEERMSGESASMLPPDSPDPIRVANKSTVRELLDRIARSAGYEWEWEEGAGSGSDRLILYRDPLKPRSGSPAAGWGTKEEWRIDPVRHGTLRGVLEEWTARAGWTLVWEADEVDYAVQAPAVFLGTFDAAVDALLRETKGRRMLVPTLWRANRYLTVREAG